MVRIQTQFQSAGNQMLFFCQRLSHESGSNPTQLKVKLSESTQYRTVERCSGFAAVEWTEFLHCACIRLQARWKCLAFDQVGIEAQRACVWMWNITHGMNSYYVLYSVLCANWIESVPVLTVAMASIVRAPHTRIHRHRPNLPHILCVIWIMAS